jgi:hypothetical protein
MDSQLPSFLEISFMKYLLFHTELPWCLDGVTLPHDAPVWGFQYILTFTSLCQFSKDKLGHPAATCGVSSSYTIIIQK